MFLKINKEKVSEYPRRGETTAASTLGLGRVMRKDPGRALAEDPSRPRALIAFIVALKHSML